MKTKTHLMYRIF